MSRTHYMLQRQTLKNTWKQTDLHLQHLSQSYMIRRDSTPTGQCAGSIRSNRPPALHTGADKMRGNVEEGVVNLSGVKKEYGVK
jgi:hypothetical protein